MSEYLTPLQVSKLLHVRKETVKEWLESGELRSMVICRKSGRKRIKREWLVAFERLRTHIPKQKPERQQRLVKSPVQYV